MSGREIGREDRDMEEDWVGCSLLDCDCFFLYFSIFSMYCNSNIIYLGVFRGEMRVRMSSDVGLL